LAIFGKPFVNGKTTDAFGPLAPTANDMGWATGGSGPVLLAGTTCGLDCGLPWGAAWAWRARPRRPAKGQMRCLTECMLVEQIGIRFRRDRCKGDRIQQADPLIYRRLIEDVSPP
jgi:hypothetical protein